MLGSLLSAIDDAFDTLYEPNAVFSQFLGSAISGFTFFSLFLSLLPLVLSFLAFLVFSIISFPFSFFAFLYFLSFVLQYFFLFFVVFFSNDLRLSCVCVVIGTTCNIYVVVSLGWQAVYSFFPGASSDMYAPVWLTPDFTFICFWWRYESRQL